MVIDSYGQLKYHLIKKGLIIPRDARGSLEVTCGMYSGEPGEEIVLALADNFIVKVLVRPPGEEGPRLQINENGIKLLIDDFETDVGVIPLPAFVKEHMKARSPISENSCLDGYCLNIFLRTVGQDHRLNLPLATILSTIESAFKEGVADLVQINMDYCNEPDRGFARVGPVVEAIKKNFSTFVGLRGFPPQNRKNIDKIYAAGVDLINFPLEGFAGSAESGELVSARQVHSALEYSCGIFGPGTVWTELFLAGGPVEDIKKKIDDLSDKGIIPLLKLQAPSMVTGKEYENIREAARHLETATRKNKLPLKWLYPACRYLTPLDTGYFTTDLKSARLSARPVYKSLLAKRASEGFAALRRKLRIKNVSDSYESAGL